MFDVFPTHLSRCHDSILHITNSGNSYVYGCRNPGLWFCNDKFHMCSAINGNWNYCYDSKRFNANNWIKVQVEQKMINNKYYYSITLNDATVYSIINSQPRVFHNMKLYVSDPWYSTMSGNIKNLVIRTRTEPGKVSLK